MEAMRLSLVRGRFTGKIRKLKHQNNDEFAVYSGNPEVTKIGRFESALG